MAHYAFVNPENIVVEVIVGKDETELIDGLSPEKWYENYRGMTCLRTSYNSKIRFNFAAIGHKYDPIDDAFIAPAPCEHSELTLNELKRWECSNVQHDLS